MRRKKWIPVVIIALFFLITTGFLYQKIKTPKYHYELSPALKLSFTNADEVIETIREALVRRDSAIHIHYEADDGYMDDVEALVKELMRCACAETEDPRQGDYLFYQYGGYDLSYGHAENGRNYYYDVTITPRYYTTPQQEAQVTDKIEELMTGFSFTGNTSDEEKVKEVYNYIKENVDYDVIHKTSDYHLKSTAYAALFHGSAGCQGYSVLLYRMLRECGVNCRIITGMSEYEGKKEFHAWNIVALNGRWYNLDVTWDHRLESERYYLVGKNNFTDHYPDEQFLNDDFISVYPISEKDFSQ